MKFLIAFVLLASFNIYASVPHTFNQGEKIEAIKINENFDKLTERRFHSCDLEITTTVINKMSEGDMCDWLSAQFVSNGRALITFTPSFNERPSCTVSAVYNSDGSNSAIAAIDGYGTLTKDNVQILMTEGNSVINGHIFTIQCFGK
jgi:hypothetical protein